MKLNSEVKEVDLIANFYQAY